MVKEKYVFAKQNITKTLSQSIYNHLKKAIVTNKLKANQRIIEKDIAEMFGVSTTPVREALLRLAAEGYLLIDSHRKTIVKEASITELKEILQVIAELDTISIGYIAEHIKPEHLKHLKKLTEQMEQAGRSKDIRKYLELNVAIHKRIWDILPNKVLQRTLEFVHRQLMRYMYSRISAFQEPAVLAQSIQEHKKILRALENKDTKALKSLVRSNWSLLLDKKLQNYGVNGVINDQKEVVKQNKRHRLQKKDNA